MMLITLEEAKAAVRVDGEEYDDILEPLIATVPSYLKTTTGVNWETEHLINGEPQPLAKTTAKFLVLIWFDAQTADSDRLKRTIDNLLTTLTALGREDNG